MPKALVEIGGRPILWHVIGIYAAQGFERFLLATGYLGEAIEEFVAAERWPQAVVDRVRRHRARHADRRADRPARRSAGGGDVLRSPTPTASPTSTSGPLLDFHRGHGGLATMTVVRPHLQWGVAELDDDGRVAGFVEKPRSEHWINGGFFCFEPGALAYLDEDSVLEREPLERLAADGELHAYRHEGFWDCMDTYKDAVVLDDLWAAGDAPWKVLGGSRGETMSRALVTGGHGFVGSHLARALLARGEAVRVLDRPAPRTADVGGIRRSGLDLLGIRDEVELVEADLRDVDGVTAAVAGVDSVFHLAAQTIVGVARESPLDTFEVNVRGAWNVFEACRAAEVGRVRLRLLRQGLRLEPRAPLPRGLPAAGLVSLRRQQGRGGHRRPQLRARLRPAAGGDPLRQRLRRRRPQLLSARAGDGDRGPRRAPAGDPLRRQPRARLPPRRRRGRRLPRDRRRPRVERRPPGRPSTPAASGRTRCARSSS